MEQTNTTPQGKGMAVTGFVLTLVGLLFAWLCIPMGALVGMWMSYLWLAIIAIGTLLAVMGMMKLGKTGGKKGLAITGLVLGLVGLIWGIVLLMGTMKAKEGLDTLKEGFQNVDWEAAKSNMESAMDTTATTTE